MIKLKAMLLLLRYLPAIWRTMVKEQEGVTNPFSSESNEFLRFVWFAEKAFRKAGKIIYLNECEKEIQWRVSRGQFN